MQDVKINKWEMQKERKIAVDERSLTPTSLSHNSSQPRTTEQRVLLLWRWHSGRKLPKPSNHQPRVRMPTRMTLWPSDTSSSCTRSRPSTSIGVRPSGKAFVGRDFNRASDATSDLSPPNFWRVIKDSEEGSTFRNRFGSVPRVFFISWEGVWRE